MRSDIRVYQTE